MQYDLEPGNFVINPLEKNWGIGQIQSIIRNKATVNFQHVGKMVINLQKVIIMQGFVQKKIVKVI